MALQDRVHRLEAKLGQPAAPQVVIVERYVDDQRLIDDVIAEQAKSATERDHIVDLIRFSRPAVIVIESGVGRAGSAIGPRSPNEPNRSRSVVYDSRNRNEGR